MIQRIHSITKNREHDEPIGRMEPLLIGSDSKFRTELSELVFELTRQSTRLGTSLPNSIQSSIVDLMRIMNSYYSNLIEGLDIHPIDIERVMNKQIEGDDRQVQLQYEAKAHVEVQNGLMRVGYQHIRLQFPAFVKSIVTFLRKCLRYLTRVQCLMIRMIN